MLQRCYWFTYKNEGFTGKMYTYCSKYVKIYFSICFL